MTLPDRVLKISLPKVLRRALDAFLLLNMIPYDLLPQCGHMVVEWTELSHSLHKQQAAGSFEDG
ncbi:hypothetical protein ACTXT7_009979 [Hymenolepis weldensis]